ncbi:unnamed protein product [Ambrosiozyma monospora]|uniref:Unnamed protein product n=1 Tax=Ambrosiozyma monospora TaxID=43982 RepID=A0ACB5TK15_AMBMO|nr:unnamed protein product [Ambrosiozyma monospora]
MICEPIVLKSINDDVVMLIDFLDNLERMDNFQDAIREFLGGPMSSSMKLNTVNSIMMEKSSSSSGFVGRRGSFASKSTIRKKSCSSSAVIFESDEGSKTSNYNDDKEKKFKDISSLKAKLILGITFGVISLTVVMVWRELSAEFIDSPKLPIGGSITPELSSTVSSSLPPTSSYVPKSGATVFLDSEAPYEVFSVDDILIDNFNLVTAELSRWGSFLFNESLFLIHRAKLTIVHLISIFT